KLEFTAGLVYAFNNQPALAKQTLQNLISSIDPQKYPQMRQAVQAFDQVYFDAADLFSACQAALDILTPAYQEEYEYYWGYRYPVTDYCRSSTPILAAINIIDPTAATDLPTILRNSGIEVLQSAAVDALNDGDRDWVISALLLSSDDQSTIFAIQHNGRWVAQEVNATLLPTTELTTSLAYLPGLTYPAVVILDGDEISIVEVNMVEEEVTFTPLLNQWAVAYNIIPLEKIYLQTTEFGVYHHIEEFALSVREFSWDQQTKSFVDADVVSNLISNQNLSSETINILQHLFQDFCEYYKIIDRLPEYYQGGESRDYQAKLLYAIGLVYQFNGDTTNAIQTYYRVWTEFPGTPYALMARAKLEPLSP
ncbi:MAG: tetratricopeptide repeat protein, partial [Chloroflexota bacterium]